MLTLPEMALRVLVALLCGGVMGWEREMIGKEAGIRTSMLVAAGAALFAMIGLSLPFIAMESGLAEANAGANGAMGAIANIVIGVGFLGAGMIFKDKERVHGLTTAAVVWTVAALGGLAGLGLLEFAVLTTIFLATLLYLLRQFSIHAPKPSRRRPGRN